MFYLCREISREHFSPSLSIRFRPTCSAGREFISLRFFPLFNVAAVFNATADDDRDAIIILVIAVGGHFSNDGPRPRLFSEPTERRNDANAKFFVPFRAYSRGPKTIAQ